MRLMQMEQIKIPYPVLALIALLLFIAAAPMPYGFYTFIRIVVCGCAGVMCYQLWDAGYRGAWLWMWGMVAILFNPVAVIHMTKEVWIAMDTIAGFLFGYAAWVAYTVQKSPSAASNPLADAMKKFDDDLRAKGYKVTQAPPPTGREPYQATFTPKRRIKEPSNSENS